MAEGGIVPRGNSGVAKPGTSPDSLANLAQLSPDLGPVDTITFYTPDGSEGTYAGVAIPANTVVVKVGANKTAGFPMPPGSWHKLRNVNPADIMVDSGGVASQLVFFTFGGPPIGGA